MCRPFTSLSVLLTLALASTVSAGKSHDPKGVHLSFGSREDEMVMTWTTRKDAGTDVRYGPGDAGGGAPADLAFNATGDVRKFVDYGEISSVRYVHVATLESLAPGRRYWYQVGDAKLGRWSKIFWFNARRTQEQYTEGPPLRIIALCDIGLKGSDSVVEFLTKEIHGNDVDDEINNDVTPRVDALVQCGDFAYDLDDQNGQVGDKFMAKMEPIAAYVPWMTSAGNHEASRNFTHYAERFVMPDSHKTNNHYYSIDVGPVHLVAYNTEALFWPGSFGVEYIQRMYDWMDADLASVDRVKTPWVIVHGHRPMYCPQYRELTADEAASGGSRRTLGEYVSGEYDDEEEEEEEGVSFMMRGFRKYLRGTLGGKLKKKKKWRGGMCPWEQESSRKGIPSFCEAADGTSCAFNENAVFLEGARKVNYAWKFPIEDLFQKHGVDLAFYGHEHEYWRSFPVYDEKVVNGTEITLDRYFEPKGTVHVVTGAGGNANMDLGDDPPSRGVCQRKGGLKDASPWCAFQSGVDHGDSRSQEFAYGVVTFESASKMTWEHFSALDDGKRMDTWSIETSSHGPFDARVYSDRLGDADKIATER